MSIMLTAIRVDRLEGFSETLLIAHDTENGLMVGRNLEIESGKDSEWRSMPPVPMRFVSGGDFGESSYQLMVPTVYQTITHGSNDECPEVQSGEWTRCLGHQEAITVPAITPVDAAKLRNIAKVLQDICPEEMTDEGCWLMKWVNDRSPLPRIERTCEICGNNNPHADNCPYNTDITCGRPSGHDGACLPEATVADDLILASMPEKGGRSTPCGKFISARTLESDVKEDR